MEKLVTNFKKNKFSKRGTFFLLLLFSFFVESSFGYCIRPGYVVTLSFILLLLLKFARWCYVSLTLLLTLVTALYSPIGRIFGSPNYNIFISAFYTNVAECKGFLTNIPVTYYVGSFLFATLGIFISRLRLNSSFKTKQIMVMAIFVITSILYNPTRQLVNGGGFYLSEITFTPMRFLKEAYATSRIIRDEHERIAVSLSKKDSWKILTSVPKWRC